MERRKACRECGIVKAATLTNFSPNKQSKDGLSGWCRTCRNAYERNKRAEKMEGKQTREEIERKEAEQMKEQGLLNTTQFAQMLGVSRGVAKRLLIAEQVPAFRVESRFRQGGEWRIKKEDAEEYCRTEGAKRIKKGNNILKNTETLPVKEKITIHPVGSSNQCGSCGVRTGNIVGDVDPTSLLHYGYLCSRCTRLLNVSNGDITKIEMFLNYIRKTRG